MSSTTAAKADVPSSAASILSGTTVELFHMWCTACWQSKETDLQAEARGFFTSLLETTQVELQEGTVLQTTGSQEQALAVLIQSMGPIWKSGGTTKPTASDDETETVQNTSKRHVKGLVARRRALSCLTGALEGCSTGTTALSSNLVQSLSEFLLTLAGPVQMEDPADMDDVQDDDDTPSDGDLDEQLRDAALTTLQVLLKSPLPLTEEDVLTPRLVTAQSAVQQRCAVPEFADDDAQMGRVRSGLATLPRSRRSLCFSTLEAPVDSLANSSIRGTDDTTKLLLGSSIDTATVFVKFCASCLHGESDPRCLLQILHLLHKVQTKLGPFFTGDPFPASEVFDAVAPYYPIQFTPPPNDVHGITREGLSTALWNVLSYTENDAVLLKKGFDTMVSLTLGILLDTLTPPPEDGPPSLKEQEEAMEGIHGLLLGVKPPSTMKEVSSTCGTVDRLVLLEPSTLRQVLDSIWGTHGQAAGKMASNPAYRKLTYQCRTFVSQLALTTEQATNTKEKMAAALFVTVVMERLQKLSVKNPNDLAYLACLASSGGVRCLQMCVKIGLSHRIESLGNVTAGGGGNDETGDACDDIAAIVAACKAGCDRITKRGVTLSPHPLQPYASSLFFKLHGVLIATHSPNSAMALVGLLSAAPSYLWDVESLLSPMVEIVNIFLQPLVLDASAMETEESNKQWTDCCVQILSHMFALAESGDSDLVLSQEPIRGVVRDALIKLVDSSSTTGTGQERFDRQCVASACEASGPVAGQASSHFIKQLITNLSDESYDSTTLVEAIAMLIQKGGTNVSRALQNDSDTFTLLDVIPTLLNSAVDSGSVVPVGMSTLELPPTDEEERGLETNICKLYQIVLPIIPDYSKVVVPEHRSKVLAAIEKLLPPLEEVDVLRLSLLLPFAARLSNNSSDIAVDEEAVWVAIKSYVADFALGDSPLQPRRFAAETLHGVLANMSRKEDACPILPLMGNLALPELATLKKQIEDRERSKKNAKKEREKLLEMVAFVGLLGSASTYRGGSSAETSSRISDFLIDLATGSKSTFVSDASVTISFPSGGNPGLISMAAGDAFGSMLMSATAQLISGQRLRYFAVKRFRHAVTSVKSLPPGMVIVASHLCCSVGLASLDVETCKIIFEVVLGGLKMLGMDGFELPASARKLALAALIKMLNIRPDVVEPFVYAMVTGVLRTYATTAKSDDQPEIIACKILALQVLEGAAVMPVSKEVFSRLKLAVITILTAALNEKSSVLRHASVDTLNSWHAI